MQLKYKANILAKCIFQNLTFSVFFYVSFSVGMIGECPIDTDPCLSSVYVELDAPTRSTLFNVTTSNENDYTLNQEWYRSVSGAGGDMSTEVVYTGQCNAYAPIYLTGKRGFIIVHYI